MSGPNLPFTGNSPQVILLPSGGPEGLESVRVVPPAQAILLADAGAASLLDAASFRAVQEVMINCEDTFINDGDGCTARYPVRVNNAMTRFWLWLDSLSPGFGQAGAIPALMPVNPPPFEIQIRAGSGNVSETVFQGIVTPSSFKDNGLIVGLDGYLCSQWEVWGRVPNVAGDKYPLMVKFHIFVDRMAQRSTGAGPTLGRLVTATPIQYYP
jgi:hypothetical protein